MTDEERSESEEENPAYFGQSNGAVGPDPAPPTKALRERLLEVAEKHRRAKVNEILDRLFDDEPPTKTLRERLLEAIERHRRAEANEILDRLFDGNPTKPQQGKTKEILDRLFDGDQSAKE